MAVLTFWQHFLARHMFYSGTYTQGLNMSHSVNDLKFSFTKSITGHTMYTWWREKEMKGNLVEGCRKRNEYPAHNQGTIYRMAADKGVENYVPVLHQVNIWIVNQHDCTHYKCSAVSSYVERKLPTSIAISTHSVASCVIPLSSNFFFSLEAGWTQGFALTSHGLTAIVGGVEIETWSP